MFVAQEYSSGCAVACVAALLNIPYRKALSLFDNPKNDHNIGFSRQNIAEALSKAGVETKIYYIGRQNSRVEYKPGAVVFIGRCWRYPVGHYLLRVENGWMDPWINYPKVRPAEAGLRRRLPGKPVYAVVTPSDR